MAHRRPSIHFTPTPSAFLDSFQIAWWGGVMVDVEQQLRGASLRVTAPRLAVLAEVHAQPHADVDRLAASVRERLGSVSTQAVYDVLRALTQAGLVRRIEPAGSPARFEARVGDNHHHVVCRGCGEVGDVDCAVGEAPCLEPSNSNGFVIDEAEVTYWGTCPACRTAPVTAHPKSAICKEIP
jgi:Fur family ferric uptake transcriptional regulator